MTKQRHLFLLAFLLAFIWSGIVFGSWHIAASFEREKTLDLAKKEAYTAFNKDLAFRHWASDHGGVYVPVSEKTQPNPYLNHLVNRDIETPSGNQLTLMNPAYMLRQMMTDYEKSYGTKGIITSLKQLNPINKPDAWTEKSLRTLESQKLDEVFEISAAPEGAFLQLLRPMYTQQSCLKCHAIQGYNVGDLRGGIGVRVALAPYLALERASLGNTRNMLLIYWLAGMLGIALFTLWGRRRLAKENAITQQLLESNQQLQESLAEIKTLRGILPICSYCKKIRDDQGWSQLEAYLCSHSEAHFSHGICPDCYEREKSKLFTK